jgi:hypothetical protein
MINDYYDELEGKLSIKHNRNESPEGRTRTLGKSSVVVDSSGRGRLELTLRREKTEIHGVYEGTDDRIIST